MFDSKRFILTSIRYENTIFPNTNNNRFRGQHTFQDSKSHLQAKLKQENRHLQTTLKIRSNLRHFTILYTSFANISTILGAYMT